MNRKDFFTQELYENPYLTVMVLNELVESDHVADKEMYQSGTFLFMEVYDNEETRKILSPVISNMEAYMEYNNKNFTSDEETQVGLCALQNEHYHTFGNENEIKWNFESERFDFATNMID